DLRFLAYYPGYSAGTEVGATLQFGSIRDFSFSESVGSPLFNVSSSISGLRATIHSGFAEFKGTDIGGQTEGYMRIVIYGVPEANSPIVTHSIGGQWQCVPCNFFFGYNAK
ncbi:MAG: hypothetical protein ACYDBV_01360, partial [Nitrospiria bacterium]